MSDTSKRIMIEVDEAAVHILANVEYCEGLGEPAYPAHAGAAIREATRSAPSWVNGRPVYHLDMREAHAEAWRDWCEAHGDLLKTFPDQRDREYGGDPRARRARVRGGAPGFDARAVDVSADRG